MTFAISASRKRSTPSTIAMDRSPPASRSFVPGRAFFSITGLSTGQAGFSCAETVAHMQIPVINNRLIQAR